jgi:hypothetical protein
MRGSPRRPVGYRQRSGASNGEARSADGFASGLAPLLRRRLAQLAVERGRADAEQLRGLALVAAALLDRALDVRALEGARRGLEFDRQLGVACSA